MEGLIPASTASSSTSSTSTATTSSSNSSSTTTTSSSNNANSSSTLRPGCDCGGECSAWFVIYWLVELKSKITLSARVSQGFMSRLEVRGIPEDMRGKDKIVFGNIQQIYDWHRDFFLVELERCVQNHDLLADLFIRHNKPRSEFIVIEYENFFEVTYHFLHRLIDYLIKPIQRITKYQLLLKDFLKYTSKAGLDCEEIEVSRVFLFTSCILVSQLQPTPCVSYFPSKHSLQSITPTTPMLVHSNIRSECTKAEVKKQLDRRMLLLAR
uniref:DH domain-containing protein n=1 Tax=Mola mola TaxID=94237 RepID=A0A3Q3WIC3_MOLML